MPENPLTAARSEALATQAVQRRYQTQPERVERPRRLVELGHITLSARLRAAYNPVRREFRGLRSVNRRTSLATRRRRQSPNAESV